MTKKVNNVEIINLAVKLTTINFTEKLKVDEKERRKL